MSADLYADATKLYDSATAWLATNPADDCDTEDREWWLLQQRLARHVARLYNPTPITEEVLLRLGDMTMVGAMRTVEIRCDPESFVRASFRDYRSLPFIRAGKLGNGHFEGELATLGDLYSLCHALKIELKEEGDA